MPCLDDSGVRCDWTVRRGQTWRKDLVASIAGQPVNLAGHTVRAAVYATQSSTATLATFATTVQNAAAGQFRIEVPAAQATLAPGSYWWALEWSDGTRDVALASGAFTVKAWPL